MGFQWFLSEEGRGEVKGDDETVSTGCGPPSVLRPGCYCYICKRQFCGFPGWAFCPLEGGGADILVPGLHVERD